MTQGEKKTPIASDRLVNATKLLNHFSVDERRILPVVRNDMATLARVIREENERLGEVIKSGKRQVGGMQAKIAEQAKVIQGLERRLEELEGAHK